MAVMHTSDGTRLHVEVDGPANAPVTVVFSHGIAMSTETWVDQRAAVAASGARGVYYDHRGFGRSAHWSGEDATIETLASDLAEVVDRFAPKGPVVLVGHSMGTLTIQALAEARPELFGTKVTACVLAGAPGSHAFVTLGMPWGLHKVLHRASVSALVVLPLISRLGPVSRGMFASISWWAHGPTSTLEQRRILAEQVAGNDPRGLGAYIQAVLGFEGDGGHDALGKVRTVLVHGRRDRLVSVKGARRLEELIRGAELVEFARAGHMVHNEVADNFDTILTKVLAPYLKQAAAG